MKPRRTTSKHPGGRLPPAPVQPRRSLAAAFLSSGWMVLVIVIVAALLYFPSLEYGFVFDDHYLVEKNPAIGSIPAAIQQLIHLNVGYRPVRTLSYAVDRAVGGNNPMIFHLSNVIYHLLVLLAFWMVLRLVVRERGIALAALAVFALQPVHIDAVAYISGRRDLLSTLFSLLAFWCFLQFRKSGRIWWWPLVAVFFGLAFFSKEMGIVVPVIILLYEWVREMAEPGGEGALWRSIPRGLWRALRRGYWYYLPMLLAGAGLVFYKVVIQSSTGKLNWWGGNLLTNFLTVAKVFCYYLFAIAFPFTLRADYSYDSFPVAYKNWDLLGWLALPFILGLVLFLFAQAARGRFQLAFWGLWFFATLLPVAHIIPHHELMAEHYVYMASMGCCVPTAMGLAWLAKREKWLAWGLAAVAATVWIAIGLRHMDVYGDETRLFADVLNKAPNCVRANIYVGDQFFFDGELAKALPFYERVLAIPPQFEREGLRAETDPAIRSTYSLDGAEYMNRQLGDYLNVYRKTAHIYRSFNHNTQAADLLKKAARFGALEDVFYSELGDLCASGGDFQQAVGWYEKALAAAPGNFNILSNLGAALNNLGRFEESVIWLSQAVRNNPGSPQGHFNLAVALWKTSAPPADVSMHLTAAIQLGLSGAERESARRLLEKVKNH